MSGFIKLHDEIFTSWEWRHNPTMFYFFCRIIRMANWKEGRFEGIVVKRGQFISSLQKLTANTLLPTQVVRTCIARLKSTREITCESTSKFTIYTIVNYSKYQDNIKKSTDVLTDVLTDEQQASNRRATTIEEVSRNKEVKEISAPVKKPATPPNSEVKLLLNFYADKFKARVGFDYVTQWAKHGKLAKGLLSSLPFEEIKERVVMFFDSDDPFIQKAGYDFGIFVSQINKLMPKKPKSTHGLWEVF